MEELVSNLRVVAVRGSVAADIPFARRTVIARTPLGVLMELERYEGARAIGTTFTVSEVHDAYYHGDATWVSATGVQSGMEAWLCGDEEVAQWIQQALLMARAWVVASPSRGGQILLVLQGEAEPLLERVCRRVLQRAEMAVACADTLMAVRYGRLAWLMAARPTVQATATYVAALMVAGDEARAAFHMRAARNTAGAVFADRVQRKVARLLGAQRGEGVAPTLFLDIDDVLNSRATRKRQNAGLIPGWTADDHDGIDPENVVHLNAIVDGVAGLRVVLSSDWRNRYTPEEVTAFLRAAGYSGPDIRDDTPSPMCVAWGGVHLPTRGSQIRAWLDWNAPGQTSGICVLDDIHGHEMRPVGRYLVQTAPKDGLRANHVSRARRLLGV